MSALSEGDVIALFTDERDSNGYLSSDLLNICGASSEHLVVASGRRLSSGELLHPPGFQSRCLFRVEAARSRGGGGEGDILYGQPIVLIHLVTDMCIACTSPNEVMLLPAVPEGETGSRRIPQGGYFFAEPRYKLRSEGDRISAGDHILLHSRRYAGSYLHINRQVRPKYAAIDTQVATMAAAAGAAVEARGEPAAADELDEVNEEDDNALLVREVACAAQVSLLAARPVHDWVVQRFASSAAVAVEQHLGHVPLRAGDCLRLFHREREGALPRAPSVSEPRSLPRPLARVARAAAPAPRVHARARVLAHGLRVPHRASRRGFAAWRGERPR